MIKIMNTLENSLIKKLLEDIKKESFKLCKHQDPDISNSAAKINKDSYTILKMLNILPPNP